MEIIFNYLLGGLSLSSVSAVNWVSRQRDLFNLARFQFCVCKFEARWFAICEATLEGLRSEYTWNMMQTLAYGGILSKKSQRGRCSPTGRIPDQRWLCWTHLCWESGMERAKPVDCNQNNKSWNRAERVKAWEQQIPELGKKSACQPLPEVP